VAGRIFFSTQHERTDKLLPNPQDALKAEAHFYFLRRCGRIDAFQQKNQRLSEKNKIPHIFT
jgi:hypothetical protein